MMERIRVFGASVVLLLGGADVALAEITIHEARYEAGILLVRGETARPRQRLTLDGLYKTRTDRNKRFMFRIPYLPRDCIVDIRAGDEVHPAVIANCNPVGAWPPSQVPKSGAPKRQKR